MNIWIKKAQREQAEIIARFIMMAMTDDCCLYFCGEEYGLEDFHRVMTELVEREDSQYSWKNTLVAMKDGELVGISTSYDGGQLHALRLAFVEAAQRNWQRDFSSMDDETQAGELYLDSLAVLPSERGQGIATELLKATAESARELGIPQVGLLVDKGNPRAEKLYTSVGFRYEDDNEWGGHPMKHLVMKVE